MFTTYVVVCTDLVAVAQTGVNDKGVLAVNDLSIIHDRRVTAGLEGK